MARTQAADYAERRQAILGVAARLYGKSGFLRVSIADLALACGISKSLLYHYFSSKDDILYEIMTGHVDALRQVAETVADIKDPATRLRALTRGFMALYVDATGHHKVLINDLDKLPDDRRAAIVATERHLLATVDRIVSELSKTPDPGPETRRALTMFYFGMINWTHTWFDPNGPLSADDVAELVVGMCLRGFG